MAELADVPLTAVAPHVPKLLRRVRRVRRLYVRRYGTWSHLVQFLAVGFSGAIVNLGLLTLLLRWGVPARISVALAIGLSMLWNFALNRRFSFSYARAEPAAPQLAGFVTACSVGAAINYVVTTGLWGSFAIGQVPAALGIAAGTGFNFITNRYLVFRVPAAQHERGRGRAARASS